MRMWRWAVAGILAVGMYGCGVPRTAGALAGRQVQALSSAASEDAAVREALRTQAAAWTTLEAFMGRHDFGGVAVTSDFVELVAQASALARRQKALIDAGTDDPAANRRALEAMRKMWADVKQYMGE